MKALHKELKALKELIEDAEKHLAEYEADPHVQRLAVITQHSISRVMGLAAVLENEWLYQWNLARKDL